MLFDWLSCGGTTMKFRLRRVVTTAVLVIYVTFFLIYLYPTIERVSSRSSSSFMNLDTSEDILKPDDYALPLLNSTDLKSIISSINSASRVRNSLKFGKLSSDAVVVVVQVHNRAYYLKELINSLEMARGISEILLVFSHDVYNDEINELIRKIDFCRVLQIFYPQSIQSHPKVFPGEDPNDCPRDIKKQIAIDEGCNNALHPDLYGHYREASITQTKHHWWWKINTVMDKLEITKKHDGLFLFMEEDHFVAKDFLHMLALMLKSKYTSCPLCNILTLGNYATVPRSPKQAYYAEVASWVSSKHNMGMALSRSTWNSIKSCAAAFCTFDDYNWDWTLQFISATCLPEDDRLTAMMLKVARVYHIGECGIHHKGKDCERSAALKTVNRTLNHINKYLFPSSVYLSKTFSDSLNYRGPKANGGWGDIRDHHLCMSFIVDNDIDSPSQK